MNLSGLVELCDITPGEDLQMDLISRDKAAILLGILAEATDAVHSSTSKNKLTQWQQTGITLLKQAGAKKYY